MEHVSHNETRAPRVVLALGTDTDTPHTLGIAVELAARTRAELDIVHVLAGAFRPTGSKPTDAESFVAQELGKLRLDHANEVARRRCVGRIDLHLRFGEVPEEVLEVVRRVRADYLVAGPLTGGSWRRTLFGSVGDRLLRGSPCEVVLAHAQ